MERWVDRRMVAKVRAIVVLVGWVVLSISTASGFQKGNPSNEQEAQQLVAQAQAFGEKQQFGQALDALDRALRLDNHNADAWLLWGYYHHLSGNSDAAIIGFHITSTFEGEYLQNSLYNLACAYSLKNEPAAALDWLRQAFAAGFQDFDVLNTDADLNNLRKLPEYHTLVGRARKGLQQTANANRIDRAYQYHLAGKSILQLEEYKKAIPILKHGIELDPLDGEPYISLGVAHQFSGDYASAKQAYRTGLDWPMARPIALFNLACVHALDHETDKALEFLEQSIETGNMTPAGIRAETDLYSLHGNAKFEEIVNRADDYPPTLVQTTQDTSVKAGDKELATLPTGTQLAIRERDDTWGLIDIPGSDQSGWIRLTSVKPIELFNITASTDAAAQPDATDVADALASGPLTPEKIQAAWTQVEPLLQQGKYSTAIKMIDPLLVQAESLGDSPLQVQLQSITADFYSQNKDYFNARKHYQKAADVYKRIASPDLGYAQIALPLAESAARSADFDLAEKSYNESVEITKRLAGADSDQHGRALLMYAQYLQTRGRKAEAGKLFEQLFEKVQPPGEQSAEYALFVTPYTFFLFQSGETDKAISMLQDFIENSKSNPEFQMARLSAENQLAGFLRAEGQFDKAIELLVGVIEELESMDVIYSLETKLDLGVTWQLIGDYENAHNILTEVQQQAENAMGKDSRVYVQTLSSLSELESDQGRFTEALSYAEQAHEIAHNTLGDEHFLTAQSLAIEANMHRNIGNQEQFEEQMLQAIQSYDRIFGPDNEQSGRAWFSMGVDYYEREDFEKSKTFFQRALQAFRNASGTDNPMTALAEMGVAETEGRLGKFDTAFEKFDKALPLLKQNASDNWYAAGLTAHGSTLLMADRIEEAAGQFAEAAKLFGRLHELDHPDIAKLATLQGVCDFKLDRRDAANSHFQTARQSVRAHTSLVLPGMISRDQLNYLQKKFRPGFAIALSAGLKQQQDERARSLSAGWLINGKMISQEVMAESALLTGSDATSAVQNRRLIENQISRLSINLSADEVEQKRQLQQIADLEKEQERLTREIARLSTRDISNTKWISIGQVRESIPAKSVFFNFARFQPDAIDRPLDTKTDPEKEHYVVWVIPATGKGDIEIIDLGSAREIDELVKKLRIGIQGSNAEIHSRTDTGVDATLTNELTRLSEKLLKPFLPHLKDVDEIILGPDGNLWLIPWCALLVEPDKYLIESHTLRYALSGRELVWEFSKRPQTQPPAIFANPDYGQQSNADEGEFGRLFRGFFNQLSGTRDEVEAILPIVKSYAGQEPKVLTGNQATESQLKKLNSPQSLVLSTHGFFVDEKQQAGDETNISTTDRDGQTTRAVSISLGRRIDNPLLRCGLALAGANGIAEGSASDSDDGVLTGLEIVGCNLKGTELVVLSACETGIGDIDVGEGVAGLRQAFQVAGAKTVVSSLWKVPDAQTAEQMESFWKNLAAGQSNSTALRNAQIEMILNLRKLESPPYPFFWAAFTVTGE